MLKSNTMRLAGNSALWREEEKKCLHGFSEKTWKDHVEDIGKDHVEDIGMKVKFYPRTGHEGPAGK
jgi:hypothetical protein